MSTKHFMSGWLVANQIMNLQMGKNNVPVLSTHYLYGTPSESGNIGLRVGDTVTYYDGAVLPALPNSGLQYAIRFDSGTLWLYSQKPYYGTRDSEKYYLLWSEEVTYQMYKVVDGDFVLTAENTVNSLSQNTSVSWANFDVLNTDGSVYLQGSEPVSVGGIVDYVGDIPVYEVFK